jgi:hypothetical protein
VIFGARGAVNKASFYFDKDEEKIKPILGHISNKKRDTKRSASLPKHPERTNTYKTTQTSTINKV